MNDIKIPQGYQQVMPYLIIKNAEGFLAFAEKVFNATEKMRHMRDEKSIMHAELQIGECTIMLADATEEYPIHTGGFFIYVANADEAYKNAIDNGATSLLLVSDQPYGRSGGVTDPFGNVWWITSVIS